MMIEYPKIPHDKKKSVKLKNHDIEAIHWLFHVEKWTIPQIADRFNVTPYAIRYHIDPEFRQKRIQYMTDLWCRLYNTDKKFRMRENKRRQLDNQQRLKIDPLYKKYNFLLNQKWQKENRVYRNQYEMERCRRKKLCV